MVLSTVPLSLREIMISAFPAASEDKEKLPLKELLFRIFSQSAEIMLPSLSHKVRVSVIGAEIESVPAVQETIRVSDFKKVVV